MTTFLPERLSRALIRPGRPAPLLAALIALQACQPVPEQAAREAAKQVALPESMAENFRMYVSNAPHVLLVAVSEERIERRRPEYNIIHRQATVIRSFKGDWKQGETVRFNVVFEGTPEKFSGADTIHPAPAPRFVLFLDQHGEAEMALDPGLYWRYEPALEPLLNEIPPAPGNPSSGQGPVNDAATAMKIASGYFRSKINPQGPKDSGLGDPEVLKDTWNKKGNWIVSWFSADRSWRIAVVVHGETGEAYQADTGTD